MKPAPLVFGLIIVFMVNNIHAVNETKEELSEKTYNDLYKTSYEVALSSQDFRSLSSGAPSHVQEYCHQVLVEYAEALASKLLQYIFNDLTGDSYYLDNLNELFYKEHHDTDGMSEDDVINDCLNGVEGDCKIPEMLEKSRELDEKKIKFDSLREQASQAIRVSKYFESNENGSMLAQNFHLKILECLTEEAPELEGSLF
ncbi:uncharacterized protein LOC106639854 [Copidosoma floridanum]|uniref:uncharacterized protein LOC106639854 n=1 Tax=Copidosoma floridanum TaxID=29053 RepID=UPI0006C9C138|nr:uncharacterized protein LOC106639854 [Copidosoma floridanum]